MNIRQLAVRVAYETANLFRRGGNLAGATDSTLVATSATHPAASTSGIGNEFTIRRGFGAYNAVVPIWNDLTVPIFDATNPPPCSFAITDVTLFVSTVDGVCTATLVTNLGNVTNAMSLAAQGLIRDNKAATGLATAVTPAMTLTLNRTSTALNQPASVGEIIIRCVKTG
jgi:hypothetical protein